MTETKRPLKVFLCHAHSDRDAVKALYTRLTKDGVDAWLDKEKLLPGADWEYEIRKAVREADVVVVCLSKQFNQAGFRQKEVRIALDEADKQPEGEIFIIPARLEECDTLESLRKWHWVDLFEPDGYEMLMRALRVRAERIGAALQKKTWLPTTPAPRKPIKPAAHEAARKTPPAPSAASPDLERKKLSVQVIIAIVGAAATILAAVLGSLPWGTWLAPAAETAEPTFTQTIAPAKTRISPTPTRTPTPTLTLTPALTLTLMPMPVVFNPHPDSSDFIDAYGIPMRLVPASEFTMGSKNGDSDERPVHTVYLDAFYIDKYEVTNALYEACVKAGVCDPPRYTYSFSHSSYYGNSEFDDYPVIYVDWNMAKTYCQWRGARLPTEAEWEKAARGTDGRTYPWGEGIDCSFANYWNCAGNDTTQVGSYESGKSPYGIYDLAGNVWEWVSSLYKPYPYVYNDGREALSASGSRALRGGSWSSDDHDLRASDRFRFTPGNIVSNFGFRCVRSLP
jgi:formylglycine-generating enzyme required for sulfatase activity